MKKENIFGLLMYLAIFALAVVYGLTVLQTHFKYSAMNAVWQYAVYIIGCILAGVLISALLFELGHLIGAKTGGYKVVKFTILYFTIYLENGKHKFGFRRFDGLTGETLIVPNYEKKEKPSPYPYLLYGPIFNLAWFIGTIICFGFFKRTGVAIDGDIAYGFLTVGLISLVLFIYDIVPFKTDVSTNGFALATLFKSKDIQAYNELLLAKNRPDQIGEKDSVNEVKKDTPQINTNTDEGKIMMVYKHIDEKKYDEANIIIDELLAKKDELTPKIFLEAKEQQIYIKILTTPYEEMAEYYDGIPLSIKREISSDRSLSGIRTYILMAGLFDKSRSECALVLSHVAKAYKNTLPSRKHAELVLFNDALEKVCNAHPKWELDIYKLYE